MYSKAISSCSVACITGVDSAANHSPLHKPRPKLKANHMDNIKATYPSDLAINYFLTANIQRWESFSESLMVDKFWSRPSPCLIERQIYFPWKILQETWSIMNYRHILFALPLTFQVANPKLAQLRFYEMVNLIISKYSDTPHMWAQAAP